MTGPRKNETVENKIADLERRIEKFRKKYDEALLELKSLREQQKLLQAQRLLAVINKNGKSFGEVLRLINL